MPTTSILLLLLLLVLLSSQIISALLILPSLPTNNKVTTSIRPSYCNGIGIIPNNVMLSATTAMKGPEVQPPDRPNMCTYWVVENHLLAGEYPRNDPKRLQQYLNVGVTVFIDLTKEGEKQDYVNELYRQAASYKSKSVKYIRLPIPDFGIPDSNRMKEILDCIDEHKDQICYVHCRGGIGRTGTVIGCYLVRHGNTGEDALMEVNRLFQSSDRSMESYRSPETNEQENFVRYWKE